MKDEESNMMMKAMTVCGLVLLVSMQGAVAATVDPRGPIDVPGDEGAGR